MATNPYVNKVVYGADTIIDISGTTATADKILQGYGAFGADGSWMDGTAVAGGGGSNWTLLASQEFAVSTTETSNKSVGDIEIPLSYDNTSCVVWVHVRDKAGKRNGYFYGSDAIFLPWRIANGNTDSLSTRPVMLTKVDSAGLYNSTATAYGVYGYSLYYTSANHYVKIYRRYNSSYGTINGTFKCDVYKLTMPSGMTLFA